MLLGLSMRTSILTLLVLIFSLLRFSEAACPSHQVFDPTSSMCRDSCPVAYYIVVQGSNKVCVPQTPVLNIIRPTPEPFMFIIIFDEVSFTIINSTSYVFDYLKFSWSSGSSTSEIANSNILLNFLDVDQTILEVRLSSHAGMSYPASLVVNFLDTTPNPQLPFYFKNSKVSIELMPFEDFSSEHDNLVKSLSKIDFVLEVGWTTISLLDYYPLLYLYGKYYRETLNLFKLTGINFSPVALDFFREANNKISGIKVPNVFSILIYNREYSSGWDRKKNTRLLFENSPNVQDYKILLHNRYHQFNSSSLFLDNFGIEITLMIGILILVIIVEMSAFFVFNDEDSETIFYDAFNAVRVLLRWNFLLVTIIGFFPTFIYYAMAQIYAFAKYDSIGNNLAGSIISIVLLPVFTIVFPLFIYEKIKLTSKLKEKNLDDIKYSEVLTLDFYGILHEYYKPDKLIYPLFTLLPLVRAIFFSAFTLFFTEYPIVQASLMLGLSILTIILLIIFRPYSRIRYMIMHLGYEIINFLMLGIMLILAAIQSGVLPSANFPSGISSLFIFIWTFLPVWTLGIGVYALIEKLTKSCRKKSKVPITFRQKRMSVRASMRASTRVHPIRVPHRAGILQTEKKRSFFRQKTVATFNFDNSPASPDSPTRIEITSPPYKPAFVRSATFNHKNKTPTTSPRQSPDHSPVFKTSEENNVKIKTSNPSVSHPLMNSTSLRPTEVTIRTNRPNEDEEIFSSTRTGATSRRRLINILQID